MTDTVGGVTGGVTGAASPSLLNVDVLSQATKQVGGLTEVVSSPTSALGKVSTLASAPTSALGSVTGEGKVEGVIVAHSDCSSAGAAGGLTKGLTVSVFCQGYMR